jgi:enoyl-CoA hydratase
VARDPALARVAAGNFRKETGPPHVSWEVATQFERPAQMWSMRRSAE